MYRIIDCHAHIYPEKIACKASAAIGDFYKIPMKYNGASEALVRLGDEYGVERFLVHSVATAPHQVTPINDFILSECAKHQGRLIGFASLHPDFPHPEDELARVKALGLQGVKLHPDFQKFEISDPRMDQAYAAMNALALPVLIHTGDKRYTWSSPAHIPVILKRHPGLRVICAHFGGYSQWEEAAGYLKGQDIWVDTSSSFFAITNDAARAYIRLYGEDRVLFGSDYPMWNVGDEIQNLLALGLTERANRKIFSENLRLLLGEGPR